MLRIVQGRRRPGDWLDLRFHATYETTPPEAVWIQRELSSQNAARLRRMIRDIDEEVRPAGVIVSPWPGIIAGAGVSAFGVLILAIRRPARRAD